MKKYILLLSAIVTLLASCTNDVPFDAAKQARADDSTILAYLAANAGIKAVKDSSVIYYQVVTSGSGANPTINSTLTAQLFNLKGIARNFENRNFANLIL